MYQENQMNITTNGKHRQEPKFITEESQVTAKFSAGRTLSLGNYQFARVTVTVEAGSLKEAIGTVGEILNREVSSLSQQDYKVNELDKVYSLTIEYGLTLKIAKFESNRFDVSLRDVVSSSTEETYKYLSESLQDVIKAESAKHGLLKKASDILG